MLDWMLHATPGDALAYDEGTGRTVVDAVADLNHGAVVWERGVVTNVGHRWALIAE